MSQFDLTIVGGGLAGTALLCELMKELPANSRIRIAIIDHQGEFGGGIAYGRHADPGFLLTNELQELELPEFNRWLERHGWFSRLPWSPLLNQWWQSHAADHVGLERLHLPRSLFGRFLRWRLRNAVLSKPENMYLHWLRTQAFPVPETNGWRLQLNNGHQEIRSRHVVLALGSPAPCSRPTLQHCWRFLHNWQSWPHLKLKHWLHQRLHHYSPGKRQVVIAGANASAAELVYWMSHTPSLDRQVDSYIFLASNCQLPDGGRSGIRNRYYSRHLTALYETADAKTLLAALAADIAAARRDGYTTLDALDACRQPFNDVFKRMSKDQQRYFAQYLGPAYKALTRRIPAPYASTLNTLHAQGRLQLISGQLDESIQLHNHSLSLQIANYSMEIAALLNATGSGIPAKDPLLGAMLTNKWIQLNKSGQGLKVDDDFAASERIYVLGPLLAGFSNGHEHIWHLENIPRLMGFARRLGIRLAPRLGQ